MSFLKAYLSRFVKNTLGVQNNEPEQYKPNLTANYSGYVVPTKNHILDFTKGHIESLPDWFQKESYKVVMGSGDSIFRDGRTDIEVYQEYDVHCCLPNYMGEASEHMIQQNNNYIITNNLNTIICLIDMKNNPQVDNFIELFKNKCAKIHYVPHGPPTLSIKSVHDLLQTDGVITMTALDRVVGTTYNTFDGMWNLIKDNKTRAPFSCNEDKSIRMLTCTKKPRAGGRRTHRRKKRRARRYTRSK